MSGNCDEESSGNAGVDTNPAKCQPVTSTSIHEGNTAGNHGGYSSSNSEQSTVGQNKPRDSYRSSDFDVWIAPNCSDEKKNIYDQTSATSKEDTTENRTEVETSVLKVPMSHQELQMLKKFDFKTHLSRQIPNIQVTITDDGIELIGSTERRLNDEIKAFMSKIGFKSIDTLPPSVLKVYDTCDIVKKTIDARLEKTRIICHWYIDLNENSLKVFTPDRESLFTAECEISNTVAYTEYSKTEYARDVLKCYEVKSVLEKRKSELKLAEFDCDTFLVIGLHDAVEEFSKIYEHTSQRPVTKQRLGVSKEFLNCYSKLKSDVWKTFCDIYRVKVAIDQSNAVVIVGSEKQKIQAAVSELQKEIGKLTKEKWSCEVFGPRDIQPKLQSDIISSLENQFQCSVSIEATTNLVYKQQLGQWVNLDKGLHLILVRGHMSEMAADVLVCPIKKKLNLSRLGSSMMEKGGSIMKQDLQQETILEGPNIYLRSETGNLPCLMVAYLAEPEYKHGVNMQSQVIKCIQELFCSVERAQLQSLVIPVKLLSGIPEATFLKWFVKALNGNLGQVNALKQIYLCIEDMQKSGVILKALSGELSKNDWHEYHFEHLIENLQTSFPGKRTLRPAEITISLVKGKLVDQQVDVIVNSSNIKLELDKGAVSLSILDKGGKSILDECREKFPNGIDFGEVVSTKAGIMNFKHIFHGALPHWTPNAKYSIKILEKLVFDCLMYTQKVQCRSIAFPVFGTGNLEYPWDEVANTMIDTINKYGRMHYDTTIREVKIVLFDKDIKSIQAFETKKKQTEEVKLMPEDPETPPTVILESRCKHLIVQVIPLSDTTCHHCEAVVKFVTSRQALKLLKDNPQSNLPTDGIVKSKNENSTFWTVTVKSGVNEKSYKKAVKKTLGFACTERIATLAFCLMHSTGLKFKVQTTIIRDYIYNALEKNKYLQIVKIMVPSRDEFDLMLKDDQFGEPKDFLSALSSNRPPWKHVRYSDFVEKPRLLISVLGEKKRQIDELKEILQSTIQKLVKEGNGSCEMTVKHGDLDDCVICMKPPTLPRKLHCGHVYCDACIVKQFKVKHVCPTCGSIQGVVTGDQPPGTMKVGTSKLALPGHYHCGTIEIEYVIHPGKQTDEHPNEGQLYEGITRIAYLPDNEKGKKIAKLLRVAFDRKLIFTIGNSRTTGKQGIVTWNDIHHKTNLKSGKQFGYPDDTYFDRVLDELKIKGVTENDL